MVFKPNKFFVIFLVVLSVLIISVFAFMTFDNTKWGWDYIFFILIFLILFRLILKSSYTIIMDEKGCTVKFLFYKKTHKWEELKTIRIEDLSLTRDVGRVFSKCIVFSTKSKLRPFKYQSPYSRYEVYGNVFNTFAVYFIKYKPNGKRADDGILWACDEEEMLAKIKEWGVEPEIRVNNH